MRRFGTGLAALLVLGGAASSARAQFAPDITPFPVGRYDPKPMLGGSLWDMLRGRNKLESQPLPGQEATPAAKPAEAPAKKEGAAPGKEKAPAPPVKKAPPKVSPPPVPLTAEERAREQQRLMQAYTRRLVVCDKLHELADEKNDTKLAAEADRLAKVAWEVYQKQSGRLLSPAGTLEDGAAPARATLAGEGRGKGSAARTASVGEGKR
jgi:hypothetical protein